LHVHATIFSFQQELLITI